MVVWTRLVENRLCALVLVMGERSGSFARKEETSGGKSSTSHELVLIVVSIRISLSARRPE